MTSIEGNELRRQNSDLFHESRDQVLLGSLTDVRCPERIHDPVPAFLPVGNQRPDTDDGVVDVLGELVAQLGSNLVIALAGMAVSGGKAF